MMDTPVSLELFWQIEAALVAGALAMFGVLWRRQDRLDSRLNRSDEKMQEMADRAAARHDTGLGDVWQALDDHRKESRRAAEQAERVSREFREATLRQLGDIGATLARLEARTPTQLRPGE